MYFAQHYLECLSQASYLIADESTRRAVVVDPRRDIEVYLDDAREHGFTIEGIINTHFHADFLSGHLELAKATGAWIGYGDKASPEFEFRPLADGERISLGDVTLEIMHTPGHTPESISVLVFEKADDDVAYGVLTGDALFIGDVGRPDLLASIGVSADELGAMLYDSVQNRLMGLDDAVRVFPAHGAGSACGKYLSTERQSTIGAQRLTNYAARPMSQEKFIELVTEGQPAAPGYFVYNATLNRKLRDLREPDEAHPALSVAEADAELAAGAVLVDARPPAEYATGALSGSINIGADGRFAENVGSVLKPTDRVVVLAPAGLGEDTCMRLERIGYDNCAGHLADGEAFLLSHSDRVSPVSRLTVAQFDEVRTTPEVQVVDIRNAGELEVNGKVPGTRHIPLAELVKRSDELDPTRPVVLHCAGGWRSSVGASTLRAHGFTDVSDLLGGFGAWSAAHPDVQQS